MASPRAKSDAAFHEQFIDYHAECAVTKDFDPRQAPLNAPLAAVTNGSQRIPTFGGAWMVAGSFWQYAEMFKQQMEMTYALFHATAVDAMDLDKAPPGVALHMEFSTVCQAWLPHLSPADGLRLLALYGLNAQYDQVRPQPANVYKCGACGSELQTVAGARQGFARRAAKR